MIVSKSWNIFALIAVIILLLFIYGKKVFFPIQYNDLSENLIGCYYSQDRANFMEIIPGRIIDVNGTKINFDVVKDKISYSVLPNEKIYMENKNSVVRVSSGNTLKVRISSNFKSLTLITERGENLRLLKGDCKKT
jgi:hypothetical protein